MKDLKIPIGTVGLGLMGCSIATCILRAGHRVTSLVKSMSEADDAKARIFHFLNQLQKEKLMNDDPRSVIERLLITDKVKALTGHSIVIESITEDVEEKKKVYHQL